MADILPKEIILSSSIAGISLLALLASLIFMRAPRPKTGEIDMEAAVRDAPYHLLERLGIFRSRGRCRHCRSRQS